jgi:WD40 repeat protein
MKFPTLVLCLLLTYAVQAQTGKEDFLVLKKHMTPVKAIAFSQDGKILATGGEDKTIMLWNLATNEPRNEIKLNFNIKVLQFTSDQLLLAACGPEIRLIDMQGKLIRTFGGFTTDIWSMQYNEQAGRIIAGSYAKSPKVWDFKTGQPVYNMTGHEKSCLATGISPLGDLAASGSLDRSVRIWDMKDGKQVKKLDIHSDNIFAVDFHPSGKYLLSASADKTIRLWDIQAGKVIRTYHGHEGSIFDVQFLGDGKWFLSCSADKTIILWETSTGKQLHVFEGHAGSVNAIRISPGNKSFASASDDQTVRIWKLEDRFFIENQYHDQLEEAMKGSPLFSPRQANESRQDFAVREKKANSFEDSICHMYYQKYLLLPEIQEEQLQKPQE